MDTTTTRSTRSTRSPRIHGTVTMCAAVENYCILLSIVRELTRLVSNHTLRLLPTMAYLDR